jgi:RecG-like helicase
MKADEKLSALDNFVQAKTQILISTSVIEVGINVLNATVMAIMSPERFGLSSLHQLRGRVGRGEKAGFCFLVLWLILSLYFNSLHCQHVELFSAFHIWISHFI